ncbi:MAG: hypothetical protein P1V97_34840 [Planctomycetota bacterium]|nr:hypothetical protein [Planctomycetota bacterium]
MEWKQTVEEEGYYWWKRDPQARPDMVNLLDYDDGQGLRILSFGYDSDRRTELQEWLEWSPESQFWGPISQPEG